MSAEPDFLSVEDVTQIHDEQIAGLWWRRGRPRSGAVGVGGGNATSFFRGSVPAPRLGPHGCRARLSHRTESTVFRRQQAYEVGRGARLPGFEWGPVLDPQERLYDAKIAIAERRMDKDGLAELSRALSVQG